MLLLPFAAGAVIGGFSRASALSFAAIMLLFLARPAMSGWLAAGRHSRSGARVPVPAAAVVMTVAALLLFIWLLLFESLKGLFWLGAAAALLLAFHETLRTRAPRSQAAELAGVGVLTMSAPLAFYAGSGHLGTEAGWLWFLSAGYFAISVFHVRLKVVAAGRRGARGTRQRVAQARLTLAYLVFLWAALVFLAAAGVIPVAAPLAYVPASVYVIASFPKLGSKLKLRREGAVQIALALAFCLLLIAGYRV